MQWYLYAVGFQTMVIMDLWGMAFHAVVVIAPFLPILFIWISAYCEVRLVTIRENFSLIMKMNFNNKSHALV